SAACTGTRLPVSAVCFCGDLWIWPWRGLYAHSAHGRRVLWVGGAEPRSWNYYYERLDRRSPHAIPGSSFTRHVRKVCGGRLSDDRLCVYRRHSDRFNSLSEWSTGEPPGD